MKYKATHKKRVGGGRKEKKGSIRPLRPLSKGGKEKKKRGKERSFCPGEEKGTLDLAQRERKEEKKNLLLQVLQFRDRGRREKRRKTFRFPVGGGPKRSRYRRGKGRRKRDPSIAAEGRKALREERSLPGGKKREKKAPSSLPSFRDLLGGKGPFPDHLVATKGKEKGREEKKEPPCRRRKGREGEGEVSPSTITYPQGGEKKTRRLQLQRGKGKGEKKIGSLPHFGTERGEKKKKRSVFVCY